MINFSKIESILCNIDYSNEDSFNIYDRTWKEWHNLFLTKQSKFDNLSFSERNRIFLQFQRNHSWELENFIEIFGFSPENYLRPKSLIQHQRLSEKYIQIKAFELMEYIPEQFELLVAVLKNYYWTQKNKDLEGFLVALNHHSKKDYLLYYYLKTG